MGILALCVVVQACVGGLSFEGGAVRLASGRSGSVVGRQGRIGAKAPGQYQTRQWTLVLSLARAALLVPRTSSVVTLAGRVESDSRSEGRFADGIATSGMNLLDDSGAIAGARRRASKKKLWGACPVDSITCCHDLLFAIDDSVSNSQY